MGTIRVWYHRVDADGFASAWVLYKKFGHLYEGRNVVYTGVNYNDPVPPYFPGDEIYLVDMSFPRAVTEDIASKAKLTVLDHHKTAKESLEGLPYVTVDLDHAGCMVAWNHFFPGEIIPKVLTYVEDRDLWRWKLPHSDEINAALGTHKWDFKEWDSLTIEQLLLEGAPVVRFRDRMVGTMLRRACWQDIGGHKVPVINSSVLASEVGHNYLKAHPEVPFVAIWCDGGQGKVFVSLRSVGESDVSEVAKLYGGGGHKNAAGFELPGIAPDFSLKTCDCDNCGRPCDDRA